MSNIQMHLHELEENFNRSIALELIEIFCTQYRESQIEFRNYLLNEDLGKASRLAHKMKSSALNVGAKEIGLIYQTIEKSAPVSLTEQNLKKIEVLFKKFEEEVQKWSSG